MATSKLLDALSALVMRSKCCICSTERNILLNTNVYIVDSVDFFGSTFSTFYSLNSNNYAEKYFTVKIHYSIIQLYSVYTFVISF